VIGIATKRVQSKQAKPISLIASDGTMQQFGLLPTYCGGGDKKREKD
jgi:hypothetical protein